MEVLRKEGVFRLFDRQSTLILTNEKQLERIATRPDAPLFKDEQYGSGEVASGLYDPDTTLDSFMQDARDRHCDRIEVSYDFFFGGSARNNYPDSELTVKAFKVVHDYAKKYGMAFGASLISPLDLCGKGAHLHNAPGVTWQMQEAPVENGAYSVTCRRQLQWYNNKGPVHLTLKKVSAVAFDEEQIPGTDLYYVDENQIERIPDAAWKPLPDTQVTTGAGYGFDLIHISGAVPCDKKRVLAILEYETPEIDYFEDKAQSYFNGVIDLHAQNGITYGGFYSDEMHIQFDWDLGTHFGQTEIHTRYMTPSLVDTFASLYGDKYHDMRKYMVYFTYGRGEGASFAPVQHVLGTDPDRIMDTWLFRKRYFELLSGRVVHLACAAKEYAESLFGGPIMTRAHATWQEAPTCDHVGDPKDGPVSRYDYLPTYDWGASIRENMSGCYDYFRWNEFLSGAGTDHAEGGFGDRDYYSQAFAASLGSLNRFEKAYSAMWGCPKPIVDRFYHVGAAYSAKDLFHGLPQGMQHRESDVLVLYPTQLNYPEERFGTWISQYGYCNYITQEKLLEYGCATDDGRLLVNGRFYRALVAQYELFLSHEAMDMLESFAARGGRLIWTGAPALYYDDGASCRDRFLALFGLSDVASPALPTFCQGAVVQFTGPLSGISPMEVPTALRPDGIYPATPSTGVPAALCGGQTVGVKKGNCLYLGFRVRDDQSGSTGRDIDTLYRVLLAMGGYSEGSLEAASRDPQARYIMNRFPNGCVTVANHYRAFEERGWKGGFFRDEEADKKALEGRQLPSESIELTDECILGHRVTCSAFGALSYRFDGRLTAFAAGKATGITLDGTAYTLSDRPVDLSFAQVEKRFVAPGIQNLVMARAEGPCTLTLPVSFAPKKALACTVDWQNAQDPVTFTCRNGSVTLTVDDALAGRWIALFD